MFHKKEIKELQRQVKELYLLNLRKSEAIDDVVRTVLKLAVEVRQLKKKYEQEKIK